MPVGSKFGESEKRAYISLLRTGGGLLRSASRLGWAYRTVALARKADPEFDAEVREAYDESAEPVEDVLFEAAKRGEPWAVQMFLKGRLKERWAEKVSVEVEVGGRIELEAGERLAEIAALQATLEARRQALELPSGGGGTVIDADSEEVPHAG